MERINQYGFYDLAKALHALAAYTGEVAPSLPIWDLFQARRIIDDLLKGDPIPLGVSKAAAQRVKGQIDSIYTHHYTVQNQNGEREFKFPLPTDKPVESWWWDNLRSALSSFETVFSAEMAEAITYFVPRRGIYATPALAETADEGFPEDLRQFIPDKTKDDWRAAGRCLAFNLLSASGFHVARAVEGTMESYYQLFSGKSGKTLRSWDDYHKELDKILKAKPSPAPDEKTLIEFDQMRRDYRNPIVHPRVSLDEADARILFNNGESLIIAMATEIKRAQISQGGVQPVLGLIQNGVPRIGKTASQP